MNGVLNKDVPEEKRFYLFASFAEKHGSWEAVYHRPGELDTKDKIWRFIFLDLTDDRGTWVVEVWILAEKDPEKRNQAEYYRRSVHESKAPDQAKFFDEHQDISREFEKTITVALKEAADLVLKLGPGDLTTKYSRLLSERPLHQSAG
jgi:hypothetical protein